MNFGLCKNELLSIGHIP